MTKYTNKADGIETRVTTREDGRFAVTLRDTDANETFGYAQVFPADREEDARKQALRWAGLDD